MTRTSRRLAPALVATALLIGCGDDPPTPPRTDTPATTDAAPVDPRRAAELASHARMLGELETLRIEERPTNFYFGDPWSADLAGKLRALPDNASSDRRWALEMDLSDALVRLGKVGPALEHAQAAVKLARASTEGDWPKRLDTSLYQVGIVCLRTAETRNCCEQHTIDSCLFPIRGGGVHVDKAPARCAAAAFTELLTRKPDDVKAKWLLNVVAMTLGEYPDGVPREHRVPPGAFESDEPFERLVDIAGSVGLDTFSLAGGVAVDDFDGDGRLDVVVSDWDLNGRLRYFHNNGSEGFEERTRAAGLTGLHGGLNLVQADYDNDGDTDLLVLRGAWQAQFGRHPNSLLQNDGDGTFTDVTFAAGLGNHRYPTHSAAWADYDLDGDLDLYVANETGLGQRSPCQLFRNEGDGTFRNVAAAAGVTNLGYAKGAAWGDYDGDRYPDLFVSNLFEDNRLYHNEGDGTFRDVAAELGVTGPEMSFGTWFWDFDNDGALDLFVAGYGNDWTTTGLGPVASVYLGLEPGETMFPSLYRNLGPTGPGGRVRFEDVSPKVGLARPMLPMGANFGDVDGDGYPDVYLGTGDPQLESLMPNLLLRNVGGERFADVTTAAGMGHLQKGHGIAFADLDQDGDLDVFAEMGGALAADGFRNALFRNPGFGNRWITLRLRGVRSNRSAVGARIRVEVRRSGGTRSIFRQVGSGGTFGASPLRQTIGLGKATQIEFVEIFWPLTGKTQRLDGLELDHSYDVVEGRPDPTPLRLPPIKGW